jgi:hypothetical protein
LNFFAIRPSITRSLSASVTVRTTTVLETPRTYLLPFFFCILMVTVIPTSAFRSVAPATTLAFDLIAETATMDVGILSLSAMVPVPSPPAIEAFEGSESSTVNVSSGSSAESPTTSTAMVFVVSPGANVTVPLVAV